MRKDLLNKEDLEILYNEIPEIKEYDLEDVLEGEYQEYDLRLFENAKDLFNWIFEDTSYGSMINTLTLVSDIIITEDYLNKPFAEGYVDSLENTIKLTNGKYIFMFM